MRFLILIAVLWSQLSLAEQVWIQDVTASKADFQSYILSDTQKMTYANYLALDFEKNLSTLDEATFIANLYIQPTAKALQNLEEIENKNLWNQEALQYLKDYTNQVLQTDQLNRSLKDGYQKLLCHYQILLQDEGDVDSENCVFESHSLDTFKEMNPQIETLFMNQVRLDLSKNQQVLTEPQKSYKWVFLSNSHEIEKKEGLITDILTQKISTTRLVEGNCEEFKSTLQKSEFDGVFFNKECQKNSTDSGKTASWFWRNRYPILGVGLVVSALYLADKKIVVTLPSF